MGLPLNAANQWRKRDLRETERGRPDWARPKYWRDELPLKGPLTIDVERMHTYNERHHEWLIAIRYPSGHCYHEARDSRSIIRRARAECIEDMGLKYTSIRVHRV